MLSTLPQGHMLPNTHLAHLSAHTPNHSTRLPRHDSVGLCVVHAECSPIRTLYCDPQKASSVPHKCRSPACCFHYMKHPSSFCVTWLRRLSDPSLSFPPVTPWGAEGGESEGSCSPALPSPPSLQLWRSHLPTQCGNQGGRRR